MGNIFTKSANFKGEYSAAIVRIDKLTPIEGSDFLAKTLIQGTQIVVNKTEIKEGDIMVYASNETQLSQAFLSVNNQFEIGCRELNANADEVNEILKPYLDKKVEIDGLRDKAKNLKKYMDQLVKQSSQLNKEVKKLTAQYEVIDNTASDDAIKLRDKIDAKKKLSSELYEKSLSKTTEYTELKQQISDMVKEGEPYVAEAKKKCGFFQKNGRVRCITLRGEFSFGFLASIDSLIKYDPSITKEEVEEYVGQEFDTINGELFCKAYVPPIVEEKRPHEKRDKAQKRVERLNRIIPGNFFLHYDTGQLEKNIWKFNPDNTVTISDKLHGTSVIIGRVNTRCPKPFFKFRRALNRFFNKHNINISVCEFNVEQGPVYSSRKVIMNKWNHGENGGYYGVNVWSEWGKAIYPYLDDNTTVYGEIIGFVSSGKGIQPCYDYGCNDDCLNKLMIYRITTKQEDGTIREWEVPEVKGWTEKLIVRMKELSDPYANRIHPIDILYHGRFGDLYPDIEEDENWCDNVLMAMKRDKKRLGMETIDNRCSHQVPKEGVVVRLYGDEIKEAYKLKSDAFRLKERMAYDTGNYVDIETVVGDYNTDETVQ